MSVNHSNLINPTQQPSSPPPEIEIELASFTSQTPQPLKIPKSNWSSKKCQEWLKDSFQACGLTPHEAKLFAQTAMGPEDHNKCGKDLIDMTVKDWNRVIQQSVFRAYCFPNTSFPHPVSLRYRLGGLDGDVMWRYIRGLEDRE